MMGVQKPKICKCGHAKDKHQSGRFKSLGDCRDCPCSDYFKRDRSVKGEWVMFVIGICLISLTIISFLLNVTLMHVADMWDEMVSISVYNLVWLLAVIFLFLGGGVYIVFIRDWRTMRNRSDWPVS